MKDETAFAFAGLWDRWRDKANGTVIESCTIITVPPNDVRAPITAIEVDHKVRCANAQFW